MLNRLTLLLLCLAFPAVGDESTDATQLIIEPGQQADGRPTDLWLGAISVFHDEESLAHIAEVSKPLNEKEQAWFDLIEGRVAHWANQVEYLLDPFGDINPPKQVIIVLGNQGGQDAFIAEDINIAFDLRRMDEIYGPFVEEKSAERVDRFFNHEFTHLLHKEWRRVHQPRIETPLERTLYICITEGIGNYYSLSARWNDEDGSLSAHAESVLERLQPIFVDRLSKLATATDEEAPALIKGVSMGPFDQKWGALPVALWLTQETRASEDALQYWVAAGPPGILELATKYLPPELAAQLPAPP